MHLYSRLKPGKTVHTWMEENNITERGIDPQRFVTFSTIKGFLRRVHRWPVLLPRDRTPKKGKGNTLIRDATTHPTPPDKPKNSGWNMEAHDAAVRPTARMRQTSTSTPFPNQVSFPPVPIPASIPPNEPAGMQSASTMTSAASGGIIQRPSVVRGEPEDAIVEKLAPMLDGSHNSDELCTMFRIGWHELEKYLAMIGGADKGEGYDEMPEQDTGDVDRLGRVRIIYR